MADCPHCGNPLHAELVARAQENSRFQFTLNPAEGELMTAKHVGGCIEQIGVVLKASGADMGIPTEVLVERIETTGSTIAVHLLIVRWGGRALTEKRDA